MTTTRIMTALAAAAVITLAAGIALLYIPSIHTAGGKYSVHQIHIGCVSAPGQLAQSMSTRFSTECLAASAGWWLGTVCVISGAATAAAIAIYAVARVLLPGQRGRA